MATLKSVIRQLLRGTHEDVFCRYGWHFPNLDCTFDRSKGYRMLQCQTCFTMRKVMDSEGGEQYGN